MRHSADYRRGPSDWQFVSFSGPPQSADVHGLLCCSQPSPHVCGSGRRWLRCQPQSTRYDALPTAPRARCGHVGVMARRGQGKCIRGARRVKQGVRAYRRAGSWAAHREGAKAQSRCDPGDRDRPPKRRPSHATVHLSSASPPTRWSIARELLRLVAEAPAAP